MHQTLSIVLLFSYTTANSFILGLDLSWWDSADMAFLLLILLLLLILIWLLLVLLMLMMTLSFSESMILLADSFSQEFSRDFRKYDWSLSKSDNWRGFNRNSSAPPSKHLSTISKFSQSHDFKNCRRKVNSNSKNEARKLTCWFWKVHFLMT